MEDSATQDEPCGDWGSRSPQPAYLADTNGVPQMIGITFNLPAAMPYIGCLRKSMCHLLKAANVPQEEIDDLELVVGELATNAARHGEGGNYHVEFEIQGDQATITVTDTGSGFDLAGVPEIGSERADSLSDDDILRFGGFGLPLVHSLADHVHIERNDPTGMIVQARKTVHWSSETIH